jgi:hypothetical protein
MNDGKTESNWVNQDLNLHNPERQTITDKETGEKRINEKTKGILQFSMTKPIKNCSINTTS